MFVLACLASRAFAEDAPAVRDKSSRWVKVKVDGDNGEIVARSKSKTEEDALLLKFKVDDKGHRSEVHYFSRSKDKTDITKVHYYFRFNLFSLIEFQDNDPAGFGAEDQVFNKYFFGKKDKWTPMTPAISIDDGTAVNDILKWSTTAGPLTVTAYYSPNPVVANGTDFDPDEVKFDYDIWYDWTPTSSQGSCNGAKCKLAIDARVKTILKTVTKTGSRDTGARDTTVSTARGGWHWKDTVTADGATVAVIATPVRNATDAEINEDGDKPSGSERTYTAIFTFDKVKPNHIYWDPALYASDANMAKPFFVAFITVAACLFLF